MRTPLRALLSGISAAGASDVADRLRVSGYAPQWQCAPTMPALADLLSLEPPDVLVATESASLPLAEVVSLWWSKTPRAPLVVVSSEGKPSPALASLPEELREAVVTTCWSELGQVVRATLAGTEAQGVDARISRQVHPGPDRADYRTLFECTGTPLLVIEPSDLVSIVNTEFARLVGYSREDIEGRMRWTDFVSAAGLPRVQELRRRRRADPASVPRQYELDVLDSQGRIRNCLVTITVLSETRQTVAALLDITDRQRVEQALRQSEEKFRDLADLLPEIVFEVDNGGMLTFANRKAFEITGYRPEQLDAGFPALDVFVPEDRERVGQAIKRLLAGRPSESNEYTARRADGTVFPVMPRTTGIVRDGQVVGLRGILFDISRQKRTEAALRDSRQRYQEMLAAITSYCYTVYVENGAATHTEHGPGCVAVTGYGSEDFASDPLLWLSVVPESDREPVLAAVERVMTGQAAAVEHRLLHRDGRCRWVRDTLVPHHDAGGQLVRYDGLVVDITDRTQAEQKWRTLFESLPGGSYTVKDGNVIEDVNDGLCSLTGYTRDELVGQPCTKVCARQPGECPLCDGGAEFLDNLETTIRAKDGRDVPIIKSARRIGLGDREVVVETIHDNRLSKKAEARLRDYATQLKSANLELEMQKNQLKAQQMDLLQQNQEMEELTRQLGEANVRLTLLTRVDPLTEVLNRRAWMDAAQTEHERHVRYGRGYAIVMVDVDHFKLYNDSQGHQEGDECLRRIARCLAEVCRANDAVGRYGGEEFIALLPEADVDDARDQAERICEAIHTLGIAHPQSPVVPVVTVSAGVAAATGASLDDTIRRADEALYAAKNAGRNRVRADGADSPVPTS